MTDPVPPAWGGDPLSTFLATAQWNERVSPLKLPDAYVLLQRVACRVRARRDDHRAREHTDSGPVRILMARARGAWLAAVRLALSGQTVEAYPQAPRSSRPLCMRCTSRRKPARPARAIIWLCRDDDEAAERRCRNESSSRTCERRTKPSTR